MSVQLRELGTTFGLRKPHTTTFDDYGNIPAASPLRSAYGHKLPTMLGYVAGTMRLLRDPYVVLALSSSDDLFAHVLNLCSMQLATIFGDGNTAVAARSMFQAAHRRRIPADTQPKWFGEAVGYHRDFAVGETRLKTAVAAALASGVAKAHVATGVLLPQHGNEYCAHMSRTLGWASDIQLPPTLDELNAAGNEYQGLPLMNSGQLQAIGVPTIVQSVLERPLAEGKCLRNLLPLFVPFMWPEDCEAHGIETSERDVHDDWCHEYRERVATTAGGVANDDYPYPPLTDNDMFTVAAARQVTLP